MSAEVLKLTVYFGESDRVDGELLSDVLLARFEESGVHAAALLRGVEGFGLGQHLRTDRFLTLSEDLPLVALAVDERPRVEALLPAVLELLQGGLVTLERAQLVTDPATAEPDELAKLTVYLGRDERVDGRPAFLAVVDHLRAHGLAGATVLLGVDGMAHRQRRRARFFGRNVGVPLLVLGVGSGESVSRALPGLVPLLADPIVTLERVRVCKRDGLLVAAPGEVPTRDESGLGVWQKLTVIASEQARHAGRPLHVELVRRLRAEGASGVTSLRGIWGYSGEHAPHGDRLLRVRRHVPVLTTLVDAPEAIRRWFALVDECTDEAGLVTSELVPAYHAIGPGRKVGGLKLSRPRHR